MKKTKFFHIILINIFIISSLLIYYDYSIFKKYDSIEKISISHLYLRNIYNCIIKQKVFSLNINDFYKDKGREPDGTQYKDKSPIVIFGCSFAYGYNLEQAQTFGYKLSKSLKRPVYNRAIPMSSMQYMYYQSTNKDFYKQVPKSDTAVYIIIDDHYRRILSDCFGVTYPELYLHYKLKRNKLVMDNYYNIFSNIRKSSHIYRYFNMNYILDYILKPQNGEKITDLTTAYFVETKKELEKHWDNKINFIVIFYSSKPIAHSGLLKEKLNENGFITVDINDLTKEKLNSLEYRISKADGHPNEKSWNILTPLIIKDLQKKGIL